MDILSLQGSRNIHRKYFFKFIGLKPARFYNFDLIDQKIN
jgi:hypothetical protein